MGVGCDCDGMNGERDGEPWMRGEWNGRALEMIQARADRRMRAYSEFEAQEAVRKAGFEKRLTWSTISV